ncbi:MAG: thioredoxin fold domain-containing protein [Deltaproteobacteria bacterium]|nr:thioredoxin fold domain-containing protein [Deltaproteobacteria bacterium]
MTACARFFNIGKRATGIALALLAVVASWAGPAAGTARSQDLSYVPVKGMVTMIDLGATECVPCKMMAPILEKLKKTYEGKAAIIFIDVWKNSDPARRYGIRAIPTQIFFDAGGREVHRHVGFMSEKNIIEQLTRMGVD